MSLLGSKLRSTITPALLLAAGVFFVVLVRPGTRNDTSNYSLSGATMGTSWNIQLGSSGDAQTLQFTGTAVEKLLATLDREIFSTWTPTSELSLLNHADVDVPVAVSPDLLQVLVLAKKVHAASGGSFDISVGPLVNIWGFGPDAVQGIPDAAAIAQARAQLGLEALEINSANGSVIKHKTLSLDLSGIAKGYAVDKVAELLDAQHYENYLVEIGGELRLQGRRPDGEPWIIAVETPTNGARAAYAKIDSNGETLALAGSGDYRNYREVANARFSHEIDPRSGYPVTHDLAAVTVISNSAALADAWATALMVLGPEEGTAVADSEKLAAYFIIRSATGLRHQASASFSRYLYQQQGN